jgi:hypothetical protein
LDANVNCWYQWSLAALVWLAPLVTQASETAAPPASVPGGFAPELVSQIAARVVAAEIPREYERKKDWGRTKKIATGLRSYGNFFRFDIHRDRSEVNDGVWKHYRLTLVQPADTRVGPHRPHTQCCRQATRLGPHEGLRKRHSHHRP